jgi:predicted ATPase/DNA-binding XRE family transcriptional regulator
MDKSSFGTWVKERRAALDLTQRDLAQAVGCSTITIQKIEAGARRPSRQIVERLAACLGIAEQDRPTFMQLGRAQRREPVTRQQVADEAIVLSATLPLPLTALIGRDSEVSALEALIRSNAARLVTIIGPAGVGKTRLSIAAASRLRDRFQGRVTFIALAALKDATQLRATIAGALGLRASDDAAALVMYLQAHPHLLVLDNFEQIVSAAPALAALLEACPLLYVLTTSRERLQLRGEQLFPLAPLALPDLNRLPQLSTLVTTPAVALFCAVARASQPDFELRTDDATTVAQLCVRLDGLPLAIELVAAQVALLSARTLAALDTARTLDLPGPRDLPDRQRTLRAAIDWSYTLLSEIEQQILLRLAIFEPGWHHEAAFALSLDLVDHDPHAFLAAIERLYHASFLQRLTDGERFALLETIRSYALTQLGTGDTLAQLRRKHAMYYLLLAEQAAPELKGAQQQRWKQLLQVAHENLLAALEWFFTANEPLEAARLATALWRYWWMQGELRAGQARMARALAAEAALPDSLRGQAWYGYAGLTAARGELAQAQDAYQHSRAAAERAADRWTVSASVHGLALVHMDSGRFETAAALFEESLRFSPESDRQGYAVTLTSLAGLRYHQGDFARSRALFEDGLRIQREVADQHGIALTLNNLSEIARRMGDHDTAQRYADESLALFRQLDVRRMLPYILNNVGALAVQRGCLVSASSVFYEALEILREIDERGELVTSLLGVSELLIARDEPERAAYILAAVDRCQTRGFVQLSTIAHADMQRLEVLCRAKRAAPDTPLFHNASLQDCIDVALRYLGAG